MKWLRCLAVFWPVLLASVCQAQPKAAPDLAGGSFCLEPALLVPVGDLQKSLQPAFGPNLDFDLGLSPRVSFIFGLSYYEMLDPQNPDFRFRMVPGWVGLKFKDHWPPSVEFYWEVAASGYYEKAYDIGASTGSQENLDGGLVLGSGYDLWFTRWLLGGVDVRYHLVAEQGTIFPFVQFGARLGIRG